jgi:hypothetical protein
MVLQLLLLWCRQLGHRLLQQHYRPGVVLVTAGCSTAGQPRQPPVDWLGLGLLLLLLLLVLLLLLLLWWWE